MTETAAPRSASGPFVAVEGLSVRYANRQVLGGVSFVADHGELIAVVGPNGAGKSTLFKAICGLVPFTGGVRLAGADCHHRASRARAAYLPQRADIDLAFPITVGQLVLTGRRPHLRPWRRPGPADRHAVATALREVALTDRADDPIGSLSGGQLQRAFVARALAQHADLLLLDEALAGVDLPSTDELLELFDRLARSGRTILVATHDLALTRLRFDRCLAINRALVADGSPGNVLDTASLDATFGSGPVPSLARAALG